MICMEILIHSGFGVSFMSDIHQGLENKEFESYEGQNSSGSSGQDYSGDYNSDGNTTVTAVPTMDPDAMDNTKPTETPDK